MSPTNSTSRRPRVICHMMASVDGRIVPSGWPLSPEERRQYEEIHAGYEAEGWLCGRITMEPFAGATRSDADVGRQHPGGAPREDHIVSGPHESFAFALDPSGRLAWERGDIDGDQVVSILSERVSDDYLAFLRERGVSYLLAGNHEIDLPFALEKVGACFGVRTLMLEGGGRLNGSFLHAGLIDEVSLLLVPVADGRVGTPALIDVDAERASPHRLVLESVARRAGDVLWIRYRAGDARSEAE